MDAKHHEHFGVNLKLLRKQLGITQQEIADTINTSRSCISNYESGNRQPDNETIKLLADYFDVSVDYLFGRSEVKNVIRSNAQIMDIQKVLSHINSLNTLDMSNASAYVKCAVIEFYSYLIKKETEQNSKASY